MLKTLAIRIATASIILLGNTSVDARRVLHSDENISRHIRTHEREASHFTITAEVNQGNNDIAFASSETILVDVIKAKPAITQDTYIVLADGTSIRFEDSSNILDDLLVSDTTTSAGRSGLTVLAVDPITHKTQGIIEQKGHKPMKLHQGSDGGVATVVEEENMEAPAWECGVGKEDHLQHGEHDHEESHENEVS